MGLLLQQGKTQGQPAALCGCHDDRDTIAVMMTHQSGGIESMGPTRQSVRLNMLTVQCAGSMSHASDAVHSPRMAALMSGPFSLSVCTAGMHLMPWLL